MGANSKEFVKIRMEEEHYTQLSNEVRSKMEVLNVEVQNPKYKESPFWVQAKSKASKAYKELKEIEQIINTKK